MWSTKKSNPVCTTNTKETTTPTLAAGEQATGHTGEPQKDESYHNSNLNNSNDLESTTRHFSLSQNQSNFTERENEDKENAKDHQSNESDDPEMSDIEFKYQCMDEPTSKKEHDRNPTKLDDNNVSEQTIRRDSGQNNGSTNQSNCIARENENKENGKDHQSNDSDQPEISDIEYENQCMDEHTNKKEHDNNVPEQTKSRDNDQNSGSTNPTKRLQFWKETIANEDFLVVDEEEELTEKELIDLTQGVPTPTNITENNQNVDHEATSSDNPDCSDPESTDVISDNFLQEDVKEEPIASLKEPESSTTKSTLKHHWPNSSRSSSSSFAPKLGHSRPKLSDDGKSIFIDDRLFKVGETFQYEMQGKGFLVTISRIDLDAKRKFYCAYCDVMYICLDDTFVGPEMANQVIQDERWIDQHPSKNLLLWKQETTLCARLRELGDKVSLDNKPAYVYEINPNQEKHGEGYQASYSLVTEESMDPIKPIGNHPTVLDLFSGGGGAALGFARAGLIPKYAVDLNPDAISTLERNKSHFSFMGQEHNLETYEESVMIFLKKCERKAKGYPQPHDIDHIHASPPCQGFSAANRTGGTNDLSNNEVSYEFVRAIKYFQPTTASLENVPGMLRPGCILYPQKIVAELLLMNYQVRIFVANAKYYGDPQSRCRVWIFAARATVPLPPVPPPASRTLTVWDALAPLEDIDPVEGNGRVHIMQNDIEIAVDDHSIEETTLKNECDTFGPCQDFAPTVRCQRPIKHQVLDQCMSVRQRATIQSFPFTYKFSGSAPQKKQLIGNAVPVNFATAVAQSIGQSYQKADNDKVQA